MPLAQQLSGFLKKVKSTKAVWGLQHEEGGWAACESDIYEETPVYLFWSTAAAANDQTVEHWQDYHASDITLDDFIDIWLVGMHKDEALVGLDWNLDLEGAELEPLDVAEELNKL